MYYDCAWLINICKEKEGSECNENGTDLRTKKWVLRLGSDLGASRFARRAVPIGELNDLCKALRCLSELQRTLRLPRRLPATLTQKRVEDSASSS